MIAELFIKIIILSDLVLQMMKKFNVCVLGATGLVGSEMVKILLDRNFPIESLTLLASKRTAGSIVSAAGRTMEVKDADEATFEDIDIALFAGGELASEIYAERANRAGCVVIDNSSFFRMRPNVPLVVPEVNEGDLERHKGIIANPNCSTIQMAVVLKPIYDAVGIKRVVVSTYQSVSGTGRAAIDELKRQSFDVLSGNEVKSECYPCQIAFNLIPQIGSFDSSGYSSEEMKMIFETKKIFSDDSIKVAATTVRVPVERGHCESLNIETVKKISKIDAERLLASADGISLCGCSNQYPYPTPLTCANKDDVFVGRIREDLSCPNALELWISADNIRKGAALNAVQIAEALIKRDLVRV